MRRFGFRRFPRLAAAVILGLGLAARAQEPSPQPGEAPHRGDAYPGAAFLYRLSSVRVVYPAGPGQDVEGNRRSAEARAAFLSRKGVGSVAVVADTAVKDEDRKDNLLLLGWANALFGGERAPFPFRRAADRLEVLGITVTEPDLDLLVFARSPYDPDKWLFFWSRIDPEIDRFMPLPTIGSDWAVYQDYLPLVQGMFVPGKVWPPVRDERAQADHRDTLFALRSRLASRSSEHYVLRYDAGRVKPAELDAIVRAREAAYARAVQLLGEPAHPRLIELTLYEDEEAKREMTGTPDPVHSIPRRMELHMVRRVARTGSSHEEFHLVARDRLGPAYLSSLHEGLAVALEGTFQGTPIETLAAMMERERATPPLSQLLDEEGFRALPEATAAPAAAMFVAWARASLPPAAFSRLYGATDASPGTLGKAFGKPWPEVEAAYRAWLAERVASRAKDVEFLLAQRDAKERYAKGDYPGVSEALTRALAIKPDDPQTLFNLASSQMRTDAFPEAERTLKRLLALPLAGRASQFRIFGHYQLGRVYDLAGRREEALAEYRKVLELPDDSDAHRLARERIESPATKDQLD